MPSAADNSIGRSDIVRSAGAAMSLEAEQAVLGAVLLDAELAWPRLDETGIGPGDFAHDAHGRIWGTLVVMRASGQAIDVLTAYGALADAPGGAQDVTLAYLNSLVGTVASAHNVANYAAIVLDRSRRRQVATAAAALRSAATSATATSEQFQSAFEDAAERLSALLERNRRRAGAAELPIEWATDLGDEAEMPEQLVEGLLTVGGLSAVIGKSNSGKSYLVSSLSVALADGRDWLGRRMCGASPVLYIAAEGAASIRARWQAARRHTGRQHGDLALVAQSLNLLEIGADGAAIVATAEAMERRCGRPVALIVIDTLARVTPGADENSGEDMGRLIATVDHVRQATGAHVLLVHHMGKDAGRGARGHSSLRGALDTEIEVTVDEATKTHYAKITKQRDLPSNGETMGFKLLPIELGLDQWGQPITACAVEQSEVGLAPPAPRRMTGPQQAVMGYLTGRERGARRSEIATALEEQGAAKSTVYRAINELLNGGMVIDISGVVYRPKES